MSIVKWRGHSDNNLPVARMFPTAFSDFFDSFFGNELLLGNETLNWTPAVNIAETDAEFKIEVAAPGLTKADFKVEVDNNVLSISGAKKEEKNTKIATTAEENFCTVHSNAHSIYLIV